jgi:hypothetical protein
MNAQNLNVASARWAPLPAFNLGFRSGDSPMDGKLMMLSCQWLLLRLGAASQSLRQLVPP